MKTKTIQLLALVIIGTGTFFAQDIPQSSVPPVVLQKFNKEYPKANDIEWELKRGLYNVEFEIAWGTDYEVWYNTAGEQIKYKEEIHINALPKAVTDAIKQNFTTYRIDDIDKIITEGVTTYTIELEKGKEDIKLSFSEAGKVL